MAKNLFVAGLDYSVTDDQMQELFSQFGTVASAKVIMDHDTGRSKGFGFVEMGSNEEAMAAITALNETEFQGRTLMVKEARPKGDRPSGDRFNNGGGGGFGNKPGGGRKFDNKRGNSRGNSDRFDKRGGGGGNRDW